VECTRDTKPGWAAASLEAFLAHRYMRVAPIPPAQQV
jgi:hypothetical protein